MAHATVSPLTHPSFPQVFTQALTSEINRVSQLFCTHVDVEGCECGDPAVVQFLPDGDQADCGKHLRLRQLKAALRSLEVSRG